MRTPLREPPRVASALLAPLADRLPGLSTALDEQLVLERLGPLMIDGVQVVAATAGSVWFRDDGSCSLRYRVEVSPDQTPGGPYLVLARVHRSDAAARRYVDEAVTLVPRGRPPAPWLRWMCRFNDAPVAVHPFPIDVRMPTLGAVIRLQEGRPEWWPESGGTAPSMELIRYPREGGVVLRYRGVRSARSPDDPCAVYAKVYPDTTAATVHRFLSSLDQPTLPARSGPVRLAGLLGFRPDLRLLLTEGLPGQPNLPALVHEVLSARPDASDATQVTALRAAVREAGRVLAALHSLAHAVAPLRAPVQVWRDVVRELQVVTQVWPETADVVRTSLDEGIRQATASTDRVLCHGDYTPSQILFSQGHASGLVDFDTVCWGDPAMDLGRFLAHLDLLLARAGGALPQPLRRHLRRDFLEEYGESAERRFDDALLGRVEAFRTLALAVSALHACRQLKEHRLHLALSLLRHHHDQPANNDCARRNV